MGGNEQKLAGATDSQVKRGDFIIVGSWITSHRHVQWAGERPWYPERDQ